MKKDTKISIVILAAGKSTRFGENSKCFVNLRGKPVIQHSIDIFLSMPEVQQVVVVVPNDLAWGPYLRKYTGKILVTSGGHNRCESAYNGVMLLDNCDKVFIHDAARPLVDVNIVRKMIDKLHNYCAVEPVILPVDTLSVSGPDDTVVGITDRSKVLIAQTPQGFSYSCLKKAYACWEKTREYHTDEIGLMLRYNPECIVSHVPGSVGHNKLTTYEDLLVAEKQTKWIFDVSDVDLHDLDGKSIWVIGGTRGIGAEIAHTAAKYGSIVFPSGSEIDVSSPTSIHHMKECNKKYPFDVIIYCAGVFLRKSIIDSTSEEEALVFDVNVLGALNVLRHLPELLLPGGSFVVIGSSCAHVGKGGFSAYAASKAALLNLIQGAAEEFPNYRVNIVNPGRTHTDERTRLFPEEDPASRLSAEKVAEDTLKLSLMNLTGTSLDVKKV